MATRKMDSARLLMEGTALKDRPRQLAAEPLLMFRALVTYAPPASPPYPHTPSANRTVWKSWFCLVEYHG